VTWGEIRQLVTEDCPKQTPFFKINQAIRGAYQDILNDRRWTGLKQKVVSSLTPQSSFSVSVVKGSTAVTLISGTWTTLITGQFFRLNGANEFYGITWETTTSAILSREWAGDTGNITAEIFQNIVELPYAAKSIYSITDLTNGRPLRRFDDLDQIDPGRTQRGQVQGWSPYLDASQWDAADYAIAPELRRVEVWPIPLVAARLAIAYSAAVPTFTGRNTTESPLSWVSRTAIIHSAISRITREQADATLAQGALEQMHREENIRVGATAIDVTDHYAQTDIERYFQ
jgi:hypothetical protein